MATVKQSSPEPTHFKDRHANDSGSQHRAFSSEGEMVRHRFGWWIVVALFVADLERLSRLRGSTLDLAFVQVMTARYRAGIKLAANEARNGSLPEVRQLARQMLAEQQAQQMKTWRHPWTRESTHRPAAKTPAAQADGRRQRYAPY